MATQIQKRQIADGAIDNSKIQSGAAIDTSKLAEGSSFLKKDGSVAMTGNFDAGNNTINNVASASTNSQAPNWGQVKSLVDGLSSLYKYKTVRVVATTNISLSSPGSTIDGITLVSGDRILLTGQTTQSQNGIYIWTGSSSTLTRSVDSDSWSEFTGCNVSVYEGTTNGDTKWFCPVNDGGTLDTTAITYTKEGTGALTAANFVDKEIPTGSINGSNTSFTLTAAPVSGSEHVYLNGLLQESGASNDYTVSGATLTFLTAPSTGEKLRVSYRK